MELGGAGARLVRSAIVVAIVCLLTGCIPRPQPSAAFAAYLEGNGQAFTPGDPPPGVVGTLEVLNAVEAHPQFPQDAAAYDPPIYGVLTCVGPAECPNSPIVRTPGEKLAIWLVSYPAPPGQGGGGWAIIDATSGEYLTGAGRPVTPRTPRPASPSG